MDTILGLLVFLLFVALIIGLVKPQLIIRWSKKPTRLKVFGWWILATIFIGIIGALSTSDKSKIKTAKLNIENSQYAKAISNLVSIPETSEYFSEADSLLTIAREQQQISQEKNKAEEAKAEEKQNFAKKEAEKAKLEEERTQKIEQLEREIKAINDGVDFAPYRGTIDAMQIEIVLFGTWANIILEADKSRDSKMTQLAKQLKSKVINIQIKEFPILRKEYAKVVSTKLWENDIEVSTNGTGYKIINFTGGIFAANKNKQDFQNQVYEVLKIFRFSQSRYRWYKDADQYTYWSIEPLKDSELVVFDK